MDRLLLIVFAIIISLFISTSAAGEFNFEANLHRRSPDETLCNQLIKPAGYSCTEHTVQTKDGYLVALQRLSSRNKDLGGQMRPLVQLELLLYSLKIPLLSRNRPINGIHMPRFLATFSGETASQERELQSTVRKEMQKALGVYGQVLRLVRRLPKDPRPYYAKYARENFVNYRDVDANETQFLDELFLRAYNHSLWVLNKYSVDESAANKLKEICCG
ncbi:hypothetical protein NC651_022521 [Populus alba x Populus x berolinensis]|nr:hypothetical protein NC651_022521 [Populus alba x Populus x berolinensis]